jgi:hypothetical protein
MTEMEKTIFTLLLALTERVCVLSEVQLSTNRALSQLPDLSVELQASLRDAVARGESELDQTQAFLSTTKALLQRR